MNPTILNREFQHPGDGWYQIEPKGDHRNQAAGIVQVIDDEAAAAIVNRFNAEAGKPDFAGMLVDHEHFKHDESKETIAYGWLTALQNRADGIYGQVRWTKTGKEAVDGGDYRFFSTEYDPGDLKVLNAKPRRVRPMRLDGLTLTNNPNNKGGKPITNRFGRGSDEPSADENKPNKGKTMKSVASALGLSAEASEEVVLAEVTKLTNRAVKAEGEVTPLKNRMTELETSNATLVDEQIAADLDARGIKDEKVRNRLIPVLKPLKNRKERTEFLDECVAKPATAAAPNGQKKLFNRETKPPGKDATEEDDNSAEAQQKARKITNRASELRKEMPNLSLATSFTMAQAEAENEG